MIQRPRLLPVYLLQAANFVSGLGNAIVVITIPWLILERTGSPAFAGIVVAVSALPALIVSPFSGWMVDHLGRRVVSIGSDILSAISVMSFPIVAATIGLTNSLILILALIGAIFDPAGYTARRTLLTDTARATGIDQDRLNGIHDGIFGIGWVAGPAIGAWLIVVVGAVNSFWIAAGLFAFAALCIFFLKIGDMGREAREVLREAGNLDGHGFVQGFVVLWNDKLLRTITFAVLTIAAVYLPTESVILPTYFEDLNKPAHLGFVISMLAAGTTFGAFGYGWISKRISRKNLVRVILIGSALSVIPMSFLPPLPILSLAGFALGFFWGPFNPLITTLIQERVSPDQHGRVFGVQISVFYAAPPLGMILAGLSVERWGVAETYAVLSAILSITAIGVLATKSLKREF